MYNVVMCQVGTRYIYIYLYTSCLNYSYVQINNTIDTSCEMARWCTVHCTDTCKQDFMVVITLL